MKYEGQVEKGCKGLCEVMYHTKKKLGFIRKE